MYFLFSGALKVPSGSIIFQGRQISQEPPKSGNSNQNNRDEYIALNSARSKLKHESERKQNYYNFLNTDY